MWVAVRGGYLLGKWVGGWLRLGVVGESNNIAKTAKPRQDGDERGMECMSSRYRDERERRRRQGNNLGTGWA